MKTRHLAAASVICAHTIGCGSFYATSGGNAPSDWVPTYSEPAVRQDVGSEAQTPSPHQAAGRSIEERLKELKSLHKKGLVPAEEYKRCREQILNEL